MKHNLLGMDRQQLTDWLTQRGEPAFRAQQIIQWIYQRFVTDFDQMTNLKKSCRERLKEEAMVLYPEPHQESVASDGTRKWLFAVGKSDIETVLIPEANRQTLCISSQAGCLLDCSFCATGKQGFDTQLTSAQIIGQLWYVQRYLKEHQLPPVTNVVMMGMGEPLLNVEQVWPALHLMRDDLAFGLSWKRVTVSTSGVVPEIARLAKTDVSFALSLHAPNDELRNVLVPLNKKKGHHLKDLMQACQMYLRENPKKSITIEYVMLEKINDTLEHAKQLHKLLAHLSVKINLIPYNPFPGVSYQCSSPDRIQAFQQYLKNKGLIVTVRKTRGQDILAACGQLAGSVADKTKRQAQFKLKVLQSEKTEELATA